MSRIAKSDCVFILYMAYVNVKSKAIRGKQFRRKRLIQFIYLLPFIIQSKFISFKLQIQTRVSEITTNWAFDSKQFFSPPISWVSRKTQVRSTRAWNKKREKIDIFKVKKAKNSRNFFRAHRGSRFANKSWMKRKTLMAYILLPNGQ